VTASQYTDLMTQV